MTRKSRFGRAMKQTRRFNMLAVVLLVAMLGTILVVASHAATPTPVASVPASSGTLTSGASLQTCDGSSSSQVVKFGQVIPMDCNVALALSQSGTPFAADSVWNTPLPTDKSGIAANPNNTAYQNDMAYNLCKITSFSDPTIAPTVNPTTGTACSQSTYYGNLNNTSYSAPLYVVPANQPSVQVLPAGPSFCNGSNAANLNSYFLNTVIGHGVPIPTDAHAAAGTDEEIQIYQPSTDSEWEFWRLQKNSGGVWQACWGGVINPVSQSDGIFPNQTGATATSLPLLGAVVRIEELQAGQINHAIGLTIGDTSSDDLSKTVLPANVPPCTTTVTPACAQNGISWPASRGDGASTNPLAVPKGQRFYLPANTDLSQLSPVARVIAVAAEKYGFIVDDSTTVPALNIRIGDPTTYTTAGLPDPYSSGPGVGGVGSGGLYGTLAGSTSQVMKNFPWNQLVALPFNYGEPGS